MKGANGKEDCLRGCRTYGLTGCEWDKDDGECWAYIKDIIVGGKSSNTLCYRFNNDEQPYLGKQD